MDSLLPRLMIWSGTNAVTRRKQSWARLMSSLRARALPPVISRAGRPAPSRCSESLDSPSSRDDQPRKADPHVSMVSPRPARNDSSRDFFELAEAQGLDRLRLDRRDVLVGLVGTKRRANDGAGGAAALGLTHELGDGLRDIVRIRGVLALKRRRQGLHE